MIKIIKLINGEDVIADVKEAYEDVAAYQLKKPVRIVLTERGLGMMPFSPFIKSDTVTIAKTHVMVIGDAEDDLANEYNAKFGNGLVVPNISLVKP